MLSQLYRPRGKKKSFSNKILLFLRPKTRKKTLSVFKNQAQESSEKKRGLGIHGEDRENPMSHLGVRKGFSIKTEKHYLKGRLINSAAI